MDSDLVDFASKVEYSFQTKCAEPRILIDTEKTGNSKHSYATKTGQSSKVEEFLRVRGWNSNYKPVNNLLAHLMRKSKSEGSKRLYIWHLYKFCVHTGKKPNELVALKRNQAEKLSQAYADSLAKVSPRYSNLAIAVLKAFYLANGFKRGKALELETYHAPVRFRI